MRKAHLVLADGTCFTGVSFGATQTVSGRVVMSTISSGAQELLTNPVTSGQIVCFTSPLLGNTGVCEAFAQSERVHARGVIAREVCKAPSNWQSQGDMASYLAGEEVTGLCGIDTRMLASHLRAHGSMMAAMGQESPERLLELAKEAAEAGDVALAVSCKETKSIAGSGPSIAILDLGVTKDFTQTLKAMLSDASLTLYPANVTAQTILANSHEAVVISDGPGDARALTAVLNTVNELKGKLPLLGIGLGCLVLGLDVGFTTRELGAGHHGANIPVKDKARNRVLTTTQHHRYVLEGAPEGVSITHTCLPEGSVEGFGIQDKSMLGVMYEPTNNSQDAGHILHTFAAFVRGEELSYA